ncbi:rhamnulokinase family protein [Pseudogracilibacillus sp. SE30717A]|uniref:rhamnulokinase n=1 Tax=Pseudogracilibacillus sp. SE30717A TaxID=3098293 RepID=UPI00300DDB2D
MKKVISVDLGASNGRLILMKLQDNQLELEVLHRFTNEPIKRDDHLFWDITTIFREIITGLKTYAANFEGPLDGIGVDTWGVDFGLISWENELLEDPYSYRDTHTAKILGDVHQMVDERGLFKQTGVEPAPINTLYQLFAIQQTRPELLEQASTILTLPSLVNFLLTGEKFNEFTHASTTQLMNVETKNWDEHLMKKIFQEKLPLAPIKKTNTVFGYLKDELIKEVGISHGKLPVLNVPGHDTSCALVAMAKKGKKAAFMSCGTWVLMGIEVEKPVTSDEAFSWGFTNEGTAEGKYRLQKNNMGLWLLQQCKKEWSEHGEPISYAEANELMLKASPFQSFINPDDEIFFNPQSMVKAIQTFCKQTGQKIPQTKGEIIRCILESLALKYRWLVERLEKLSAREIPSIHMAGGGIQNSWFCQFTANATKKPIQTGPIEASAIGNALSQFIALGQFKDVEDARKVVAFSVEIKDYIPQDVSNWDNVYKKFIHYI